ncbi:MAG: NAD(P)-binding domain-containing protein, partial [Hyphomicrobiaceae bacterium]
MKETIGWIGVGSMGHRMSRHLVEAGYPVVVADAVSTERAPKGATVANSNAELARQADIIILSLPDGNVSQAVAKEIAAVSPRRVKTVIDTSTIGIKAAEAVASLLAAADIAFVDAPVSGGTAGADKATLAF